MCILYAHTRSFVTLAVKNDREHGKVVRALHIPTKYDPGLRANVSSSPRRGDPVRAQTRPSLARAVQEAC